MPSKKVPDMPAAAPFTGAEEFHLVQGGNSRHALLSGLATWVLGQVTADDDSAFLTQAAGDARYQQAGTGFSQTQADARYVQQTNLNPTAVAPSGRIWTGGPSPRQYWRARFTGINGNAQPVVIAELQLRETVGTPQVPSGGAAVYSSSSGGQGPGAAFDGNINTVWQSAAQPTPTAPEWIGYNYGVGAGGPNKKSINEIAVTNTYNGVFGHVAPLPAEESPTAIDVQWSDDGATWTTEWSITGIAWTGAVSQTLVFTHPHAGQSPTAADNYPTTLAALNDVDESAGLTDGKVLTYVAAAGKWKPLAPTLLADIDVSEAADADGQVLTYVAATGKWTNKALPAGGGGGSTTLAGLTDVAVGAQTNNQVLAWNSTSGKWSPASVSGLGNPGLNAHRYWIVHWPGSQDFGITLSGLQFRATPGGADQCTGGTAIASYSNASYPPANLFDGNTATIWSDDATPDPSTVFYNPGWAGYDFGAGNAKVVQEIQISPRYDNSADQCPKWGRLMYSDDGVTYFTAYEFNFASLFTLGTPRVATNPYLSVGASYPWYYKPPVAAQWGTTYAAFRGGSAANAIVVSDDALTGMSAIDSSTDNTNLKPFGRAIPAAYQGTTGNFTVTAHFKWASYNNNDQVGLWVRANANQYIFFGLFNRGTYANVQRAYYNSAWNDGSFGLNWLSNDIWLRIVVSNAQTSYFISADGRKWMNVYGPETLFAGVTFTDYGFYLGRFSTANQAYVTIDYLSSSELP